MVVEEAQTATPPMDLPHVLGFAPIAKVKDKTPVFDAARRGPDIGSLPPAVERLWVSSNSVYLQRRVGGGPQKVSRQVYLSELFAIWDYEGNF